MNFAVVLYTTVSLRRECGSSRRGCDPLRHACEHRRGVPETAAVGSSAASDATVLRAAPVDDAYSFEQRASAIEGERRTRLGRVRADSSADHMLRALVGTPVLSVNSAAALIGRSWVQAIARLVEAGILQQVAVGRRNRAFEAPDIISAFTDLERQLASPSGDTRISEPSRRVPRRGQPARPRETTQ
jgi:hypothetical protein